MCPDRDLVSAYVDGEVPSPWRERLEEHVASCSSCAGLVARYESLREGLRSDSGPGESEALARGRARLDSLLAANPVPEGAPLGVPGGWRRSISLPLPFAAAAAVLVVLLGGVTAVFAFRSERAAAIPAVASSELSPTLAKPASMDELLRFLNTSSGEGQIQLTINLPAGANLGSMGKPVIMRSDQVTPGAVMEGTSP